jgi:DNA adenine methylase
VALFTEHQLYVEPFAGGAAVALEHARTFPAIPRVISDLNGPLVAFWRHLQAPEGLKALEARLPRRLPTREEFEAAAGLEDAVAFFIRNRGSRAADMRSYLRPTCRLRRGMDEQLSAWLSAIDGLAEAHQLLARTEVLNLDALALVEKYRDRPGVLLYLDPPYLHSTRAGSDYYVHEMNDGAHERLLDLIRGAACRVVLSGYRSDLYDGALAGWQRIEFPRKNSMASGKTKRAMVECLWVNHVGSRHHS